MLRKEIKLEKDDFEIVKAFESGNQHIIQLKVDKENMRRGFQTTYKIENTLFENSDPVMISGHENFSDSGMSFDQIHNGEKIKSAIDSFLKENYFNDQ